MQIGDLVGFNARIKATHKLRGQVGIITKIFDPDDYSDSAGTRPFEAHCMVYLPKEQRSTMVCARFLIPIEK